MRRLKNKHKAIEELMDKKAVKVFIKSFDRAAPQLETLLNWTDIPYQAVFDAVYRGMINAGMSNNIATKVAYAIVKEGVL